MSQGVPDLFQPLARDHLITADNFMITTAHSRTVLSNDHKVSAWVVS